MRKLYIKQFCELAKTLDEACREVRIQTNSNCLNLCADIQEFVAKMFEYAETIFGEEAKLPGLLKELYEMLYRVSQGEISVKHILKVVHKIKAEADSMKADTIEVVLSLIHI